ncbi:extracellular solute-binding protein [Nonomuraea sp. K274]|uniref:Extracellular solute-binding protein n=1 Tax=Nonomuraea cypriaca TaxID=1187855 RepID=A0A931F7Q4_9ACTN|nr:extracellular solute-binding protein [Nonomuraea cypriaca]MBF8194436.1 extracellular solute-binding protein [Nonomuraea cypriaca]
MTYSYHRRPRHLAVAAGAALSALVLSACGVAGTSTGSGDGKSLTAVFLSGGAYDPCSDAYAKKFTAETGIKVNVIHEGYPTLHDKLLTTLSSGAQSYDVIMAAYQWIGEFSPFLSPLSTKVKADPSLRGVIPSVTQTYVFNNEQYAVPFSAQAEALFYRKDLFDKAGLKPPTTWDEFQKTAAFFTKNPKFPGVYGTSVKGGEANVQSEFNDRYYGLGGKVLGAPGSKLDVGLATKALTLLKSDEDDYSPAGARQATFVEASAQFAAGNVAMAALQPTTVLSQITPKTADNKVYGKVGVTKLPGGVGEAGGWGLTIPKSSPNQDNAYKFASYMASESADHDCFVKYGKSPVQASVYQASDVADHFYTDGIKSALETSLPRPSGITAGKINTMFTDVAARFTAGQIPTADEAAQQMAQQYDELVNDQ